MPTYVYKCPDGHKHEIMQLITDKPVEKCPVFVVKQPTGTNKDELIECGKEVQRVIQKTTFTIK